MSLLLFSLLLQDRDDIERARKQFPPHVTQSLLEGRLEAPEGFDAAMEAEIGKERLEALRSGRRRVDGRDNDRAARVLVRLGVSPETFAVSGLTAHETGGTYRVAPGGTSGFFKTGQDADIALSAIGFNDAGGPSLFNHPMGIASDGTRLLLADTYNNRVLVWNRAPAKNDPPDFVLGQKDFIGNDSGDGLDRLNFPVNVATDGTRVVVADTENHRLLIWTSFPTKSGQPADLAIRCEQPDRGLHVSKRRFYWPWGVWTDGTKLVTVSTRGGGILIWNSFPTRDDQPADLLLSGGGLGTPRTITSDGNTLIVGDHNPKVEGARGAGTFFWKTFPTRDDAPYDFFRGDDGVWLRGTFTGDGRLLLLGADPLFWNVFPRDVEDAPDLTLRGFNIAGGDHTGACIAGGRLYVLTGNLNKVVVYNEVPSKAEATPDFAIGAPDLKTNTLDTHFIVSNPVPASNGKNLFVASDFDRRLYVWKSLPDESGAPPDWVYDLGDGPWDIALWKDRLALAGMGGITAWKTLPLKGQKPDMTIPMEDLRGVAMDDRYFYVSAFREDKVVVWEGTPDADAKPAFELPFKGPGRLSSDGEWLAIAPMVGHEVHLYRVGSWDKPSVVGDRGKYNMLPSAQVRDGSLYMAEAAHSRVHVWRRVEDAIAGRRADALLGAESFDEIRPETARDKLRYPAAVCFDGAYLWVGETKFSERILRFSPSK